MNFSRNTQPRLFGCFVLASLFTLALALPVHGDDAIPSAIEVPWQQLEFQASKLFVSGKLQFKLTEIAADEARDQLLQVKQQKSLEPLSDTLALLHLRSELMSNRGEMRIWMDPRDFRVYQRERMTTGSNTRLKLYRYLRNAVYRVRKESQTSDLEFDSAQWRTSSEQLIPLRAGNARSTALHDPSALLLIASSKALAKTGDSVTATVFTDKQFYAATLTVTGSKPVEAKYRLSDYSGSRTVAAKLNTLQIELTAKLLGTAQEEEPFEFLGLHEPILIAVDPKSRLPLQVEGSQSRVGKVTVDVRKVTLKAK